MDGKIVGELRGCKNVIMSCEEGLPDSPELWCADCQHDLLVWMMRRGAAMRAGRKPFPPASQHEGGGDAR